MADDSCECVECCDRFSKNARKKVEKMECPELLDTINRLTNTEKRGRNGTKGLLQRFRDYLGDDDTHGTQLQDQQRSLRTYLDEYDNKGCGDPPSGAVELASRDLPSPTSPSSMDPYSMKKAATLTGGALGLGGLGYGAYRLIRFLPSLAPPLWWSIPENLAIP